MGVYGLGFRVRGLGFRAKGFRGLGLRVQDLGRCFMSRLIHIRKSYTQGLALGELGSETQTLNPTTHT